MIAYALINPDSSAEQVAAAYAKLQHIAEINDIEVVPPSAASEFFLSLISEDDRERLRPEFVAGMSAMFRCVLEEADAASTIDMVQRLQRRRIRGIGGMTFLPEYSEERYRSR